MNALEWEYLIAAREALRAAGHGRKAEVARQAAERLACSVPTLYRKLKEAGLDTSALRKRRSDRGMSRMAPSALQAQIELSRKQREDAGTSAMTPGELQAVSGMLYHSDRENAKEMLPVKTALSILSASGQLENRLSPGRVSTLLRERHLHRDQLAQQKPATRLRSAHPNHVWQIDSSTCVLYYMRAGQLAAMDRDEFYRNKPENLARVASDLCTRYAVVDHTSGAFKVRYFMGGESAQNLVDFWLYCVTKQPCSPMHGVPFMVMLDPGAANKGHLFTSLCRRMQVAVIINEVGNARAKGAVENTHNIVERNLEGRFRFIAREELTLEHINAAAEEWAAAYCSSEEHSRHHQPRYSVWMRITAEQLRVPASIEVLKELVSSAPETRRVDNTMCIRFAPKGFGAQTYDVALVPSAVVGGKVTVALNAYRAPAIDVRCVSADGEEYWQTVEPLKRDEFGFDAGATLIGEQHRTAAFTPVDVSRNLITQEGYRKPGEALPTIEEAKKARKRHEQAYAGIVDAMADVRATPVPAYLPRRGTALDTPRRPVEPVLLSVVAACKRLRNELGDAYGSQVYEWVAARFTGGVPEDQLAGICAQFAQSCAQEAQAQAGDGYTFGALRAVGGGI